jgi:hypothetical protein
MFMVEIIVFTQTPDLLNLIPGNNSFLKNEVDQNCIDPTIMSFVKGLSC